VLTLNEFSKGSGSEIRRDRKHAEEKLGYPLTHLPNRNLFYERLEQVIISAHQSRPVALLLLDLDRFKTLTTGSSTKWEISYCNSLDPGWKVNCGAATLSLD
jgi:diguanylate cyclase with GGDEF domain